jgi:hypothetical protein
MKVRPCLKQPQSGVNQVRVLRSEEITQVLMMPQQQLRGRLRMELTHSTTSAEKEPSSRTKVPIVTGLELLSLYSEEQEGTASSGSAEESSLESYGVNSLVLAQTRLVGLRHRPVDKIDEEAAEVEGLNCDSVADVDYDNVSLNCSITSGSFVDGFDDFCQDSFSRGLTTLRKYCIEDNLCTAMPDMENQYKLCNAPGCRVRTRLCVPVPGHSAESGVKEPVEFVLNPLIPKTAL